MRILDGWELYHFNIRGPLIVGVALSSITSLDHIFLNIAWLDKFTQTVLLCAFEVARSAIHIFHESDTRGLLCEDDAGGSIRMF